jgi:autotransporter-associated beta strand protein
VTTLNGGTLIVGGHGAITTVTTGTLTLNGATGSVGTLSAGTFNLNGAAASVGTLSAGTINLAASTALTVNEGTFGGSLTGSGSLIKATTGILTLTGANASFSGATTISLGELIIQNAGSLGTSAITVASGAILDLNNIGITNAITVASGGTIENGPTAASPAVVAALSGTNSINTVLTGDTGLAKAGSGELSLTTPHFFTGAVTANTAGAVIKAAFLSDTSSSLGASDLSVPSNLTLGSGAKLEFNGSINTSTARSFTIGGTAGIAATGTGTLEFTSTSNLATTGDTPGLTLSASNTGTNRFAPTLASGNPLATLAIDGTGVWVIGTGANRFKGDVRVDAGAGTTIGLENNSLPAGATVGVDQGSTLRWEAGNTAPVKLSMAAGVSATLNLGTNDIVFTTAPAVVGTGSVTLEKQGTGAMRIADNLSAPTVNMTVSGGLLSIGAGSTLGNITLASGSRLGGAGTVGVANVGTGAFLAPGNSPGTLYATTLVLGPGSTFDWEVQDANDQSNGFDKIVLSGSLDLSGVAPGQKVNFRIFSRLGSGNGNQSGNPLNFDPPGGASTIKTFAFGTVGGLQLNAGTTNISDVFTFDLSQFTYSDGSASNAGLWSIDYNAGIVTLTAVPEPSTYGFGLGALALAAAAIRRRKRQATKA